MCLKVNAHQLTRPTVHVPATRIGRAPILARAACRVRLFGSLGLVAALVLVAGCGGSPGKPAPELLSPANLDKIQNGMTMSQVQLILGQWTVPPQGEGTPKRYQWKRGEREIDVDFVADKVVAKSAHGLESSTGQSPP